MITWTRSATTTDWALADERYKQEELSSNRMVQSWSGIDTFSNFKNEISELTWKYISTFQRSECFCNWEPWCGGRKTEKQIVVTGKTTQLDRHRHRLWIPDYWFMITVLKIIESFIFDPTITCYNSDIIKEVDLHILSSKHTCGKMRGRENLRKDWLRLNVDMWDRSQNMICIKTERCEMTHCKNWSLIYNFKHDPEIYGMGTHDQNDKRDKIYNHHWKPINLTESVYI